MLYVFARHLAHIRWMRRFSSCQHRSSCRKIRWSRQHRINPNLYLSCAEERVDKVQRTTTMEPEPRMRSAGWRSGGRPFCNIRARAPLRLGLAGGGTDVSPYSEDFGGAVLNATIDRYAFAFVEPPLDDKVRFIAEDLGLEDSFPADLEAIGEARLRLHAAVYRRMISEFADGAAIPITLRTSVDAPSGSGLGSSSALIVAMVEAFRSALDVPLGPYEVAHLAFEVERIELELAGGKQDHYAAAFGGINFIEFMAGDRVIVNPLRVRHSVLSELEASLITCFSGISRRSEEIIGQQREGMTSKTTRTLESLHRLKADALEMKQALLRGNIESMAQVLEGSWLAKKETAAGVTTDLIEKLHAAGCRAGAWAGKVSGAGGGGFIMFLAPPEHRLRVIRALNEAGGQAEGVHLTMNGAESWICPNRS
jgi:D-glycero-alpha-D-manno-heptose-7-phosphate kinase